jgi:hypothetical protein
LLAPVLAIVTVSVVCPGAAVNVAVTFRSSSIVTVHEPLPVHAPLQPSNVEPAAGVAVTVTAVPEE